MKVLITGDSHAGTLMCALRSLTPAQMQAASPVQIEIKPLGGGHLLPTAFFNDQGDHAELVEPSYRLQFQRLPSEHSDLSAIGFSGPLHTTRVWREDWSVAKPWQLGGDGQAVSSALLRQIIDDDLAQTLAFIAVLRRTHEVFVVEPPWPFRHHYAVGKNGVATVRQIHQTYRACAIERLSAMDVGLVEIDTAWTDADGLMLPKFRHEDPKDQHHGNLAFGRLMLERVMAFLQPSAPAS